jgi:hypothetical protein
VGLVLALLALSACGPKTINQILVDPSEYNNKDVRVEGQVVESYSVLRNGAYQVDDGTGKLWVVSTKGVPRKGARVSVKGKIREGFNLGGVVSLPKDIDTGLVMVESSHKAKNN